MEEKLFWIGVVTGLFALLLRESVRRKPWRSRGRAAALHSLFCGGAAFTVVLVLLLSMESRSSLHASPGNITPRTLLPSLAGMAAGLAWGAWSGWRRGRADDERTGILQDDLEWADTVFSAVILASFLMYFVLQAFKIPSGSMRTTLLEGDHLFVSKFVYGVRIPFTGIRLLKLKPVERGDIVVFEFPSSDADELHCGSSQSGKDFIKRAVAVPGDNVEVRQGVLLVNGRPAKEDFIQHLDAMRMPPPGVRLPPVAYQEAWVRRQLDSKVGDGVRDHFGPVTIPAGHYMVMGDNRDRSCDSRFWGPVPDRKLKGKAWFLYWPPSRMRMIH